MSRFADQLLAAIHMLEIGLQGCRTRLADRADDEALHETRIALRTLRSLLRPLRGLPAVDQLEQASAGLGRLTNPIRERQVLVAELQQHAMPAVAAQYRQALEPAFQQLLASAELPRFFELLDGFAAFWRLSAREGCLHDLRGRVRRQFQRDLRKLPGRLDYTASDLHALRLKAKRLRYASQVYPQLTLLGRRELKLLRKLQQELGEWNDCQYWLLSTADDPRLRVCRAGWSERAQAAAVSAGRVLRRLNSTGIRRS